MTFSSPPTISALPTPSTPIRRATSAEAATVAAPLARAFLDDPVFTWISPDAAKRGRVLPAFFELFAETLLAHDETYLAGDASGAAIWVPPGNAPVPPEQADAFVGRITDLSGPDADRMLAAAELVDAHHPPGSFWFLQFVGVVPELSGRGTGSALLAHMLTRCDQEKTAAYLDATSPRNRALYERHGFRTIGRYTLPDGPPLWQMWREPCA